MVSSTGGDGASTTGNGDQIENPYDAQPFDDKIKMKRINGRGGLSETDKALMLCC